MSRRGIDFLQKWIRESLNADAYPPLNDTRAKVMAEQCAADAAREGISVGEIEVDAGDLADCMLTAMNQAPRTFKFIADRLPRVVSPQPSVQTN